MSNKRFWGLNRPDYNSDYDDLKINGSLEHPFNLPGVKCSVCGETWAGSRILPFHCPESLRQSKELQDGWPISLEAHKALQKVVLAELHKSGIEVAALRPGDAFQPCYLDVPSRPQADFLWSSLGSVVVSERVKEMLERHQITGVAFSEVVMRKVGKRSVKFPAPVSSPGASEGLINETALLTDVSSIGRYYEMIVLGESRHPPGGLPKSICAGCSRPDVDDYERQLVMRPEMWSGDGIFFLATTLYIIVTGEVREIFEKIEPTNVVFGET